MAEIDRLVVKIEADLKDLRRDMAKAARVTTDTAGKMGRGVRQFDDATKRAGATVKRLGVALAATFGTAAVLAGLRAAIGTSRDFGKALSELSAITGATGKDLDFMSEQATQIGLTTTKSALQFRVFGWAHAARNSDNCSSSKRPTASRMTDSFSANGRKSVSQSVIVRPLCQPPSARPCTRQAKGWPSCL